MGSIADLGHNRRNLIIVAVTAAAAIVIAVTVGGALLPNRSSHSDQLTDTNKIRIFPVDSKPYGLTYGEWSAKYWQWTLSLPSQADLSQDSTGQTCYNNQIDENVWMLDGPSAAGHIERSCVIPSGKAILIPVLTGECDYSDPNLKTESELRTCAFAGIEGASKQVSVDGFEIANIESYRVQSHLFNLTIPADNILGIEPIESTQAAADGYYFILEPLPTGRHTIHVSSSIVDDPVWNFAAERTENVEVK
jgi:hypothetical protein